MLSAYGAVQEHGLSKRACYGVVAKDAARVQLRGCRIHNVSEAAVFVMGKARVLLGDCRIARVAAAFMSGYGMGRALEVACCAVSAARRVWSDDDRPHTLVWGKDNTVELEEEEEDADASIAPLDGGARGDDSDSDSDDSLDEQAARCAREARLQWRGARLQWRGARL